MITWVENESKDYVIGVWQPGKVSGLLLQIAGKNKTEVLEQLLVDLYNLKQIIKEEIDTVSKDLME
jgi:hypothetical protein